MDAIRRFVQNDNQFATQDATSALYLQVGEQWPPVSYRRRWIYWFRTSAYAARRNQPQRRKRR